VNVTDKVKNLPNSPGVYLMKDSQNTITYVGKAKNLKRRVQSYFQKSKAHPQKIKKMVSNIKDFDFILTDTEFEAFMLECKLIKELKPLFNKKMKGSHSYVYIGVYLNEEVHRIEIRNNPIGSELTLNFGPFISRHMVEKAIVSLKETFKILCSNPSKNGTPCLNYSLGLCMGICLGSPMIEQHNKIIRNIVSLLSGNDLSMLEELEQKMTVAAKQFDFETAAKYRDHIDAIKFLLNKEKVLDFTEGNKNICAIETLNDRTLKLFLIKRNKVLFSDTYSDDPSNIEIIIQKVLSYFKWVSVSPPISRDEIDEAQIIYSYLKSSHCEFIVVPNKWIESRDMSSLSNALTTLLSNKCKSPNGQIDIEGFYPF
jgi:excinuclease ABC subunit C